MADACILDGGQTSSWVHLPLTSASFTIWLSFVIAVLFGAAQWACRYGLPAKVLSLMEP